MRAVMLLEAGSAPSKFVLLSRKLEFRTRKGEITVQGIKVRFRWQALVLKRNQRVGQNASEAGRACKT